MSSTPSLKMRERNCPVCGSSQNRLFAEQNVNFAELNAFAFASRKLPEYMHWRLVECAVCDLLYATPVPTEDFLAGGYAEAAFDSGPEAVLASKTYQGALRTLVHRLPDRDGAIDIGTGEGAFLKRLLELDFTNVIGIEPSAAPIQQAEPQIKPLIRHELFNANAFEGGRYSLITCFQTIEHLPDPLAIVTDAMRLLKPGGALMIVCHNRRAVSAKVLGRRSPIFDIEHLQLFSPRSIGRLFEAGGFTSLTVSRLLNRYPINYWLRLFPLPRLLKTCSQSFMNAVHLGGVTVPLAAGNLVAFGFKPRNAG